MKSTGFQSGAPAKRGLRRHAQNKPSQRWFHPRLEVLEYRCLLSIAASAVVSRLLFYDQSAFDGNTAGVNPLDDSAISNKVAYLPGDAAPTNAATAFTHESNYTKGINGLMVDLTAGGTHGSITSSDFVFRVGVDDGSGNVIFANATAGQLPATVSTRTGAGAGGSDRVELIWAANSLRNVWLEVKVLADANTGLAATDVFYFGNKAGDTANDNGGSYITNSTDLNRIRSNAGNTEPVDNTFDVNKDSIVNSTDGNAARSNSGNMAWFHVGTAPLLSAALANDTGASNTDGITSDPTVSGTLTGANGIASFKAGLNSGPITTDALPLVQPGGAFTLSPSFLAAVNGGSLPDGSYVLHLQAVDSQGLSAALDLAFTLSTVAPTVTVATMASFTSDLTPHVTVTASDPRGLANGTQVSLDVDLNNDGNFTDSGELGRTQSTLYAGSSYFQLTPALPPTDPMAGPYLVQLRVRVTDVAGNVGFSPLQSLKVDTLGNNILQNYLNNGDISSNATHLPTPTTFTGTGYTLYVYDLISQTWRTTADVDKPVWHHWLQVVVPTGTLSPTALLLIDGGNNTSAAPTSTNPALVQDALMFHAVTIDLPDVPSEPLIFTGDPGHPRSEDAILSYTFNQYTTHLDANGLPTAGNQDWPALLPMVKSAVRAMDAVQSVVPAVSNFVVTGYSKRGWTTWLTAAVDSRVIGIIPGVFDVLNLGEQLMHHHAFYSGIPAGPTFVDGFSVAIQDYVGFNIPESVQTVGGQQLGRVLDPYRYLNNGHFNIPKLELNSSGDEFFIPDSAQFYFSDLPGTKNYLRYIPNTGHPLNSTDTANSTASFYNAVINNLPLPQFSWAVQQDGSIRVQTVTAPTNVVMWKATAPTYRDFRYNYNSNGLPAPVYNSSTLTDQGGGVYIASVPTPATGATAFFVQLTFTSPLTGNPYIFTTEIKIATNIPLGAWPFFTATNGPMAAPAGSSPDFNAVASALAAPVVAGPLAVPQQPAANLLATIPPAGNEFRASAQVFSDWQRVDHVRAADDDSTPKDAEAVDLAFSGLEWEAGV